MSTEQEMQYLGKINFSIPVSEYTQYLFENMIEEKLSFGEIFNNIKKSLNKEIETQDLIEETNKVLQVFIDCGAMLLRNKNVPPFPKLGDIEK
jgi:hypothetical protein